jgi:hypothetical protein
MSWQQNARGICDLAILADFSGPPFLLDRSNQPALFVQRPPGTDCLISTSSGSAAVLTRRDIVEAADSGDPWQ